MALTPLPTPPSRADSGNFAARADAFFAALPAFQTEFNAQLPYVVTGLVAGNLEVTGTIAAGSRFDVSGQIRIDLAAGADFINSSSAGNVRLGWGTYGLGVSNAILGTEGASPLIFATNYQERVRIDGSGATYFPSVGTTASAANAFLNSASSPANQLLRSTSSLRYKTAVRDLPADKSGGLFALRPVVYKSLAPADDPNLDWYGLIAEEVAAVDPRLVHYTEIDGQSVPDGVQYDRLAVLMLAEIKALRQRVADLENAA